MRALKFGEKSLSRRIRICNATPRFSPSDRYTPPVLIASLGGGHSCFRWISTPPHAGSRNHKNLRFWPAWARLCRRTRSEPIWRECRGYMRIKHILLSAAAASIAFSALPAFAQTEEIIVTARKKQESLISVPVVVAAISAQGLEKQQIH